MLTVFLLFVWWIFRSSSFLFSRLLCFGLITCVICNYGSVIVVLYLRLVFFWFFFLGQSRCCCFEQCICFFHQQRSPTNALGARFEECFFQNHTYHNSVVGKKSQKARYETSSKRACLASRKDGRRRTRFDSLL